MFLRLAPCSRSLPLPSPTKTNEEPRSLETKCLSVPVSKFTISGRHMLCVHVGRSDWELAERRSLRKDDIGLSTKKEGVTRDFRHGNAADAVILPDC